MARRRTPEEDRANAPIMLVFGGFVTLLGVVVLVVAIATDGLDEVSRRGIPIWLLAPLVVAFGLFILWGGTQMRRRGARPPAAPSSEAI